MAYFKKVVAKPQIFNTGAALDFSGFSSGSLWVALVTLLYVDFLDTTGTLFSMCNFVNIFIPGRHQGKFGFPAFQHFSSFQLFSFPACVQCLKRIHAMLQMLLLRGVSLQGHTTQAPCFLSLTEHIWPCTAAYVVCRGNAQSPVTILVTSTLHHCYID